MGKDKHHSRHRTRDDERSDSDSNDSGSESGNERDNRHNRHDRHKSSHHSHHHHHSRHRSSHHSRYNDGDDNERDRKRERSHSKTSEVDRKRVKTTTNPQTNTLQPTENSTNPTDESSSPKQQQPQSEPVDPEIQKRRERVERWRKEQERLKKEAEERERKAKEAEASNTMVIENGSLSMSLNTFSSTAGKSTWTSGDSDDDDRSAASVPGMSKTRESKLKNMFTFTADNGNTDNGTEEESEVDEFEEFFAGIKETAQRDAEESSKKIKELLAQSAASITSESSKRRNKDDDKNGRTVFWTDEVAESLDGFYDVSGDDDDEFATGGDGDVINIADYFPENRDKERRRKNLSILEIDHSAISYPQFRKDFYVEVPEIAQMDTAEVARVRREELDGCMVHGRNCPRPIRTWGQCGLSSKIVDTLQRTLHFDVPTAIQRQAIPALMNGRDVLGCAKTGSGKTLAYVLPMLRHVLAQDPLAPGDGPIALVMAPTRELVQQIAAEAMRVAGRAVGITVAAIYGGADVAGQIAQLKRGAEIVVCTPGRMIDVLTSNGGRVTNLRRVTFVVLDEADRMFDMGFEPQVAKIVGAIRPDRQLAMFSATFPYAIEQAARKMLSSPLEIICGGRGVACKDIAQCVEILHSEDDRFSRLLTILTDFCVEQTGQALVFVNRQAAADRLFQELLGAELSVLVIHGGVDQVDRENTIMDFKRGERRILIATSVAARGLDVKGLDLVVNYEPPSHIEDYVHRVGRTGRAGRKGTAITLLLDDENDERYAPDILKALKMSDQYIPPQLAEMAQRFNDRVAQAKLQGKSIGHGSGFGGKGYKFDEEERKRANELKKLQRSMHMGEDEEYDDFNESDAESDDDDDDGGNGDEISDSTVSKAAAIATAAATAMDANITSSSSPTVVLDSKERVGDSNERGAEPALDPALMNVTAVNPPQLSHPSTANLSEDVQKALSWASRFNSAQRQLDAMQKAAVMQSHFEDEVEINDLPQGVRFQLTQRDTINQIQEYTGAAVTVRGRYIDAAAKRIDEDDRKLYLLIEATSREAVQLAKKEIKKAIDEATYSGKMSFSAPGSTRYSVL